MGMEGNRERQRYRYIPPLVPIPRLSEGECRLLDEVMELDCIAPIGDLDRNRMRVLRRLLANGCVQWFAIGRYRVTRLGRVARQLGVRR
jgi:hypothetical protein